MDQIKTELVSPVFWFSVVIMGLLLAMVGGYLSFKINPRIDSVVSRLGHLLSGMSDRAEREQERRIERMLTSPTYFAKRRLDYLASIVVSLVFSVMIVGLMFIVIILPPPQRATRSGIVWGLIFAQFMFPMLATIRAGYEIGEAYSRQLESEPDGSQ